MGDVARYDLGGDTTLTRVPYFDVPIDAEVIGHPAAAICAVGRLAEPWTDGDRVLVGQAVWVVDAGDRRLVVDPCGASDPFLRTGPEAIGHQEAVAAALDAAGVALESVDTVVLSHLDGIGMTAAVDDEGTWRPMFPRSRIVLTDAELAFLAPMAGDDEAAGLTVLRSLMEDGLVDGVDDGAVVAPGVSMEVTGAHTPGHAVIHVRGDTGSATLLGHLSLTPLDLAIPTPSHDHADPVTANAHLRRIATDAAAEGRLLVGPLWGWPGACRLDDGPDHPVPASPTSG